MWSYSIFPIHIDCFLTHRFYDQFPSFQSLHMDQSTCTATIYFYPMTMEQFSVEDWKHSTGIQYLRLEEYDHLVVGTFDYVRIESQYYELVVSISVSDRVEEYQGRHFQFSTPSLSSFQIVSMMDYHQKYNHWIASDSTQEFSVLSFPPSSHSICWKCKRSFKKGLCLLFEKSNPDPDSNDLPCFQLCKSCCQRILSI